MMIEICSPGGTTWWRKISRESSRAATVLVRNFEWLADDRSLRKSVTGSSARKLEYNVSKMIAYDLAK